jgi:hypothetical protein
MSDVSRMEASRSFTTVYTCVAPKDAVSSPMRSTAAIGHPRNIWPELCTILDTDFGDEPSHALGRIVHRKVHPAYKSG